MNRRSFLVRSTAGAAALAAGAGGGVKVKGALDKKSTESAERDGRGRGATRVVWSFDIVPRLAALTFDDGPNVRLTPPLLDVLADRDLKATFFLVAEAAERHREIVDRMMAEGHEVANHTWSHPRMSQLDRAEARAEVERGARALHAQTGTRPRWFRAPRGVLTGPIIHAANQAGHDIAMWSANINPHLSLDPASEVTDRLMAQLRPGTIYDLHDGASGHEHDTSLEAMRAKQLSRLPAFLDVAAERRYRFISLSDLASHETGPAGRSGPG